MACHEHGGSAKRARSLLKSGGIWTQAPPNSEQVCRSHPIQFAIPILCDDREVLTRCLYFSTRKSELSFSKPD